MIIIIISKHTNQNTLFQDKTTERYFHTRQVKDAYIWFMARIKNKTGAYYVINIKAKTFSHTYQIRHSGEGLLITPAEHSKLRGFYVKHNEKVFQGKGILHGLFGQIPLLNILF